MDLNLHHRTAIVTGGATGLGKEFVLSSPEKESTSASPICVMRSARSS